MFGRTTLASVMLGAALLLGNALPSLADERSECKERVRKAEQNLQREIDRHGEYGKNVEKRRQELERARQDCRKYEQNPGFENNQPREFEPHH